HRHTPELEPRTIVKWRRHIRLDLRAINAGIVGAVQIRNGPLPSVLVQARVLPADPAGLAAIGRQVDLRENSANRILPSNNDLGLVGWEQQVFALVHHKARGGCCWNRRCGWGRLWHHWQGWRRGNLTRRLAYCRLLWGRRR